MIARRAFTTEWAEAAGLPVDRCPKNQQEAEKAEKAIQEALEQLSIQEREKGTFDLHGIDTAPVIPDDDPSIPAKLKELESHIIKIEEKPAYERAKSLNSNFVDSKAFRLLMLRAENFNAAQAAERLVYHLERKQELFGTGEVLARDVRLTDLNRDDLDCVKSGFLQVGASRDVAGRAIFKFVTTLKKYKDITNLVSY